MSADYYQDHNYNKMVYYNKGTTGYIETKNRSAFVIVPHFCIYIYIQKVVTCVLK